MREGERERVKENTLYKYRITVSVCTVHNYFFFYHKSTFFFYKQLKLKTLKKWRVNPAQPYI